MGEGGMREISRSRLDLLLKRFEDPALVEKIKNDPISTLRSEIDEIKENHPPLFAYQDHFVYRLCVMVLSIIIVGVVGVISYRYLRTDITTNTELQVPQILVAIGSTALGALAGILAPNMSNGNN
jgi:hypothetical protein